MCQGLAMQLYSNQTYIRNVQKLTIVRICFPIRCHQLLVTICRNIGRGCRFFHLFQLMVCNSSSHSEMCKNACCFFVAALVILIHSLCWEVVFFRKLAAFKLFIPFLLTLRNNDGETDFWEFKIIKWSEACCKPKGC